MTVETLSDARVRDLYSWAYAWRTQDGEDDTDLSSLRATQRAEFDAWLAAHDNQVRAEALEAAASDLPRLGDAGHPRDWLRARAAEYRKEAGA